MSSNKSISYLLCNKGIIVNYINYIFYFLTFLFNQTKEFFILPLFHPPNFSFFIAFPPNLGGKNLWAQEENFLPNFSLPLFSSYSQTEENLVFHSIFLLTFSIPPNIHPTKHSVRVSRMKNQ